MPMISGETIISIIIGAIIGIVGSIIVGYIFYQKGKEEKRPCFAMKTNNLIENRHAQFDGLEITYRGRKTQNVSVSHIVFWNDGQVTISSDDINTIDPLRITANNQTEILDVEILKASNVANQISCDQRPDTKDHRIEFDYLDKEHGAVIQVIHTGITSQDIDVIGQIKGVRSIEKRDLYTKPRYPESLEKILIQPEQVISMVTMLVLITVFVSTTRMIETALGGETIADIAAGIALIPAIITGLLAFWLVRLLLYKPAASLPKDLDLPS